MSSTSVRTLLPSPTSYQSCSRPTVRRSSPIPAVTKRRSFLKLWEIRVRGCNGRDHRRAAREWGEGSPAQAAAVGQVWPARVSCPFARACRVPGSGTAPCDDKDIVVLEGDPVKVQVVFEKLPVVLR